MIVKNNNYYQELFKKINSALKYSDADAILHIEDYYTALEEIKNYVLGENGDSNNPKNDPYFLIMPVESDEHLFKINANTRDIEIPDDFRKNGVAVQGDDNAEIIYFSIDRYFDLADLYHKEIFILWNPPGKDGKPVTDGTMAMPPINKSLHYKPNHVVFGCPIVREMTEYAGEMEMSIRFYDRDEQDNTKLTYSFSTKPIRVKIQPCKINELDISNLEMLDAAIINRNQEIYNSLRRSETAGPEGQAATPIWDNEYFQPAPGKYHIDDLENEKLHARAKFSEDEDITKIGLISYSWSKSDEPKTSSNKHITNLGSSQVEYINVTATTTKRENNDIYYTLKNGEYVPYAGIIPPADDVEIFKMRTVHTPEGPGYYYLTATNKLSRKAQKSTVFEDCWHIPKPVKPDIVFSVDGMNTKNIVFDKTSGNKILNLTATPSDNGTISIQWQYAEKENDTPVAIENTSTELVISDYGFYSAVVTNAKNKAETIITTDKVRVTDFAKPVVVSMFSAGSDNYSGNDFEENETKRLKNGTTITIVLDKNQLPLYDQILYKWEKATDDDIWEEIATIIPSTEEEITTHTYVASEKGYYRVTIINQYNTDIATLIGPTFAY